MLFYDTSRYVCPCGDTAPGTPGPAAPSVAPWSVHRLPDLFFCPHCHALRCPHCCDVEVVCKYCPSCMAEYTGSPGVTRCQKTCVECPECTAPLRVAVRDAPHGPPGKQFHFACGHCPYAYTTQAVTRPAPLPAILRHEQPPLFRRLHDEHARARQRRQADAQPAARPPSPATLARMRQMGVPAGAAAAPRPQPVDIDADFVPRPPVAVPRGCHLSAKHAYSCGPCGARLLSPAADARLMRYAEKELAPELVPLVTARLAGAGLAAGTDSACVLNIVNPLPREIAVAVATLEHIPGAVSRVRPAVSVSLPVTRVTVPPRRDKAPVLDSVPTLDLTASTQAARGERLARAVRREALRRAAGPDEPLVEHGANWASVPFTVTVFDDGAGAGAAVRGLRLPFHVSVEAQAPDHWPASHSRRLRYGFWVLCDVPDGAPAEALEDGHGGRQRPN